VVCTSPAARHDSAQALLVELARVSERFSNWEQTRE